MVCAVLQIRLNCYCDTEKGQGNPVKMELESLWDTT